MKQATLPVDELTRRIIGAAIVVHDELGPGLLESAYEACLAHELTIQGLHIERQKILPVVYKGLQLDCGYRLDLLVEGLVVVELKSVEQIDGTHCKQLLTYLKLSKTQVGLIINFNVEYLREGVKRIVNGFNDRS